MAYLTKKQFELKFQADPSNINSIYNEVIIHSPLDFTDFAEFEKTIEFLTKKYIDFNDYLHSNNLLQFYKIQCNKFLTLQSAWSKFLGLRIYSKRTVKYYLMSPHLFWGVINELSSYSSDPTHEDYTNKLDNLIVDILDFYKKEYIQYPDFLEKALINFVNYYKLNLNKYSDTVDEHIAEIEILLGAKDHKKLPEVYGKLDSQNVDIITEKEKQDSSFSESSSSEKSDKINETFDKYYAELKLSDNDYRKKILVMGDDKFLKNTEVIKGIGKKFNIKLDQFEIYNDYDKLTSLTESKINKTQYSSEYIGIIFGSMPHSVSGKGNYSSIISKVESTEGFPLTVKCVDGNGVLKITKSKFINALITIVSNYKSMND